jgi:hypothetical protein
MNTKLALEIAGGRLDDMVETADYVEARLGARPLVNLQMEITAGNSRVVLTVRNNEVLIKNTTNGKTIIEGDVELVRAALRGIDVPA